MLPETGKGKVEIKLPSHNIEVTATLNFGLTAQLPSTSRLSINLLVPLLRQSARTLTPEAVSDVPETRNCEVTMTVDEGHISDNFRYIRIHVGMKRVQSRVER